MSYPQPPQSQSTPSELEKFKRTARNAAIFAVIACPLLALLPPRKLNLSTVTLLGMAGYSANHLVQESSGRSIWQHLSRHPGRPMLENPGNAEEGSMVGEIQKENRGSSVSASASASALEGASRREAWKVQREREIKEDVESGKGYGDMIMDQIWEVWNQGKVKEEDEEEE